MQYIYAALLLHKAGQGINEGSVKKVLESAGVKVDDTRVKALVAALNGVDIEAAVKEAIVSAAAPAAGGASPVAAKNEDKKKEAEKSAEAAAAGLGALFG